MRNEVVTLQRILQYSPSTFPSKSVKAAGTHIFAFFGLSVVHANSPSGSSIILMGPPLKESKDKTMSRTDLILRAYRENEELYP